MQIDNTEYIRKFIELSNLQEDEFFKIEALIRAKDNLNNDCMSAHSGSFLLHSWIIRSVQAYDKYLGEMVAVAKATGARLYIILDKKSTKKLAYNLFDYATDLLKSVSRNNTLSPKNIYNSVNSITSRGETSVHEGRMWLIDIDHHNIEGSLAIADFLMNDYLYSYRSKIDEETAKKIFIIKLRSPNGCHLIIPRILDISALGRFKDNEYVTIKENAMTVVFANTGVDL